QRLSTDRPRFPSAFPPVWNVPERRITAFVGREHLLKKLEERLVEADAAVVIEAITGLGGVGKTQLALEWAFRYRSRYDLVWWVQAEEPATLIAEYAALAKELKLPEGEYPDQALALSAVRRALEEKGRWLLVLDGAEGPSTTVDRAGPLKKLRDFIPRAGTAGHVLITSRHDTW